MSNQNLKYKNIAISGGAASGKGTLLAGLRECLEPLGWTFRSGGGLLREFTGEKKIPNASLANDDFHKALDAHTEKLFEKGHIVVESWLAGFIARERTDTLRIFVYCSNNDIRIDRVINRDHVDVETAKKIIFDREHNNFTDWKRIYGEYDFWSPKIFHLIIDTYSLNKVETLHKVLDKIGFLKND